MDEFPDEVAPEYFLDEGGLLIEVGEAFIIDVLPAFKFEAFAGVVGAEVGLDGDSGCLFAEEFLAFDVHFELGLDLEGGSVVPGPVLLALVGPQVVDLPHPRQQRLLLSRQFH